MKIQAKILILAMLATLSTCSLDATFKSGLENFSHNIFHEIARTYEHNNIIFSPFSAQTCLAMVRMGADGETAAEMDHAMGFSGKSSEFIADNYFSLLSQYENSSLLHVANKIYVMTGKELQDNFKKILTGKFYADAETINFGQNVLAAETINNWVESKTNNLIKDIIKPQMLSSHTRLVLLNAIHFKGEWLKAFKVSNTEESDFYIDETNTVQVPMMYQMDNFEFAYLREIDADALRLPYKDSDLSMLIFLPDDRNGLTAMENKLKSLSLEPLTKKLTSMEVQVMLPKFKAELTMNLNESLKQLNMHHLFENTNFSKMLKSAEGMTISQVIQKAFIEVNEMGTEAAAATGIAMVDYSMPPQFNADHPFHYFILNNENIVLFEGNVVNFNGD